MVLSLEMDIESAAHFLSLFTSRPKADLEVLLSDQKRVRKFAKKWWDKIEELKPALSDTGLLRAYRISDVLISLTFDHGGRVQNEIDSIDTPDYYIS